MANKTKKIKETTLVHKGAKKNNMKQAKRDAKSVSKPGSGGCRCDQSSGLATSPPESVQAIAGGIHGSATAKRLGLWAWGRKWELLKWVRTLVWVSGLLGGVDLSWFGLLAALLNRDMP